MRENPYTKKPETPAERRQKAETLLHGPKPYLTSDTASQIYASLETHRTNFTQLERETIANNLAQEASATTDSLKPRFWATNMDHQILCALSGAPIPVQEAPQLIRSIKTAIESTTPIKFESEDEI